MSVQAAINAINRYLKMRMLETPGGIEAKYLLKNVENNPKYLHFTEDFFDLLCKESGLEPYDSMMERYNATIDAHIDGLVINDLKIIKGFMFESEKYKIIFLLKFSSL